MMSNGTGSTKPLTEEEIKNFAAAWYYALDIHAPVEEAYRLLADTDLNMDFPDGAIRDFTTFKKWYDLAAANRTVGTGVTQNGMWQTIFTKS